MKDKKTRICRCHVNKVEKQLSMKSIGQSREPSCLNIA